MMIPKMLILQVDFAILMNCKYSKGECFGNTTKSNDWALRKFYFWQAAQNEKHPDD